MFGLLGWMIFGLLVGAAAKLVMPGRDPGGLLVTMLLGLVGAVIGGAIGRFLAFNGPAEPVGFVMALIGSVLILVAHRKISKVA